MRLGDPRAAVIGRRLAGVKRIVAVGGGKGGVGKSVVSSTLALALARQGRGTGLLDLDLTGASDHVVLGIDPVWPEEDFGVRPPRVHGIHFLSITCFGGARPLPLRGPAVSDAILELLCITRWGDLDVLVVDMPPGLGDVALDAVRLLPTAEHLAVVTPSAVARDTVGRYLAMLERLGARVLGVLENQRRSGDGKAEALAREHAVPLAGSLPYDETLERACGSAERLAETPFFEAISRLADSLR